MVWPAIIGGAALLGSSILGYGASKSDQRRAESQSDLDRAYSKEFAQSGIQWRAADAKKAGINPLAAMGAQIPSYSPPVNVGGGRRFDYQSVGQDLSRVVRQASSSADRKILDAQAREATARAKIAEFHALDLERKYNTPSSPPIPNKMGITEENLPPDSIYEDVKVPTSSSTGVQKGLPPMGQYVPSRTGYLTYFPSQQIMDIISESVPAAISFYGDVAKYKWVMSEGQKNPNSAQGKWFKSEKANIEKNTGQPVYWAGKWRLEKFRSMDTDWQKRFKDLKKFDIKLTRPKARKKPAWFDKKRKMFERK